MNRYRKSICFVTGIPGAGKTLVGLNLAVKPRRSDDAGSVFLSGNGPLVEVLQEALARDKYERARTVTLHDQDARRITKTETRRESSAFIQPVRGFVREALGNNRPPHERIVIFDEAQRVWDRDTMDKFVPATQDKPGLSQPEYLLGVMDRHKDWAVFVCLVGGGQEINHNEAGLPEWFHSIRRSYPEWGVYVSPEINGVEYLDGHYGDNTKRIQDLLGRQAPPVYVKDLYLATSIRSFRNKNVSEFVRMFLDCEVNDARSTLFDIKQYPIVVTRDFDTAKRWLHLHARGSERVGIIAAAKSCRLRPHGIYVEITLNSAHWFLNDSRDPRSSNSLEYVATEFTVQGLELDWACVAWDADLTHMQTGWLYMEFRGDKWTHIRKDYKQRYLKNAYRVLLTRARQGMVIFIPHGDIDDQTRKPEYYNMTYDYLHRIGIPDITCM